MLSYTIRMPIVVIHIHIFNISQNRMPGKRKFSGFGKMAAFTTQVVFPIRRMQETIRSSVTRFGEISPFWPKFKLIWQHFEGLFSICPNFECTLATIVCFWANLYCSE